MSRRQSMGWFAIVPAVVIAATVGQTGHAVRVVEVRGESPTARVEQFLAARQWKAAQELIARRLARHDRDGLMQFHAACALSQLGERDAAAAHLLEAVKSGYSDWRRIGHEPLLDPIRDHARYAAILRAKSIADELLGHFALDRWKREHSSQDYNYVSDEALKLHFATVMSEEELRPVREMIQLQIDQQADALFTDPLANFVFVAIPAEQDFLKLIRDRHAHGAYQHSTRRLVVRDVGRSLRHELTHVLHQHRMDATGQAHPIWIQEGLATLYEHYEFAADSGIRFLPNDRDTIAQYLLNRDQHLALSELASLSDADFNNKAARCYPQVRSFFRFMAERGLLEIWYRTYERLYREDASGIAAIEEVFAAPLDQIEREWRDWIRSPGLNAAEPARADLQWPHDPAVAQPKG